jgi:hypothetical protein
MPDIFAALKLAIAASKTEDSYHLFSDVDYLYNVYSMSKQKKLDFAKMAETGELKATINAAYRLISVAQSLSNDPAQMKNLAKLLSSLKV